MKKKTFTAAALTSILLAGCGGGGIDEITTTGGDTNSDTTTVAPTGSISRPTYRVDQSWTFRLNESDTSGVNNTYRPTYTIASVEADGAYTLTFSDPTGYFENGREAYNADHAQTTNGLVDISCTNTPPLLYIKYPLSPSTTWSNDSVTNCDDGDSFRTVVNHRVDAAKNTNTGSAVTVPAGRFNDGTWIITTGSLSGTSAPTQSITQSTYYSPTAKTVVYRQSRFGNQTHTEELLSYVP